MSFNPFAQQISTGLESFPEAPLSSFGIFKNGVFEKFTTDIGTFVLKRTDIPKVDLGLTKECESTFTFSDIIPKMPYTVSEAILEFYHQIQKHIKSEVFSIVFWDKEKEDFVIHVPKQTVSYASISYERTPEFYSNSRYIPIFESHSHNNFQAFFSGTDLADETASRYYGVYGKVDSDSPQFVGRVASKGVSFDLTWDQLFDAETEKLKEDSDYSINFQQVLPLVTEKVPVATTKTASKFPSVSSVNSYQDDFDSVDFYSNTSNNYPKGYDPLKTFEYDLRVFKNKRFMAYDPIRVENLAESLLHMIIFECQHSKVEDHIIIQNVMDGFDKAILSYGFNSEGTIEKIS